MRCYIIWTGCTRAGSQNRDAKTIGWVISIGHSRRAGANTSSTISWLSPRRGTGNNRDRRPGTNGVTGFQLESMGSRLSHLSHHRAFVVLDRIHDKTHQELYKVQKSQLLI